MTYPSNLQRFVRQATSSLLISLFSLSLHAAEVRMAVATNFTDATRSLAADFEKKTGHTTLISYGSTGKLYAQILHGAPFDVFLAADVSRPEKAENEGLAVAGSRFIFAQGKLVLWSPTPNLFTDGAAYLQSKAYRRIAIANPKMAPYGLAAQQILEHLGLWTDLQRKLVRGDSIAQAFQFVATHNAQAGFVAASQAKAWAPKPATVWPVPDDYYAAISQAAVLLKRGENNPAAIAFLKYLKSDEAREIIVGYGYAVE